MHARLSSALSYPPRPCKAGDVFSRDNFGILGERRHKKNPKRPTARGRWVVYAADAKLPRTCL